MVAVAKVDQPKGNTHLVTGSLEVALEQVSHSKIATDCSRIAFLTRHVRTRALRADYFHTGQARQIVRNLILHSYREIGVLAIRGRDFRNGKTAIDRSIAAEACAC